MNRLQTILSNRHTSISAAIGFVCVLGSIWLPQYKEKFHLTLEAALSYAALMAGDAKPQQDKPKDQ